jgi:hypothetical protein
VLENGPGEERVDTAKTHVVDRRIDSLVRGIVAHVDDQRLAARSQDAVHFSLNAATGLLKFLNAARQTMKSNVSSANGSAAASPWRNSTSTPGRAA